MFSFLSNTYCKHKVSIFNEKRPTSVALRNIYKYFSLLKINSYLKCFCFFYLKIIFCKIVAKKNNKLLIFDCFCCTRETINTIQLFRNDSHNFSEENINISCRRPLMYINDLKNIAAYKTLNYNLILSYLLFVFYLFIFTFLCVIRYLLAIIHYDLYLCKYCS